MRKPFLLSIEERAEPTPARLLFQTIRAACAPALHAIGEDEDVRIRICSSIGSFALFVSCFIAACHNAPSLTPQEQEGQRLYSGRCAHCHEDNDLALKKVPPDLHGVFRHNTLPSGAPATDAEVRRTVLSGKNMMPSFAGRFTDEQMAALLAYLHVAS